ncbi:MAG: hypothetical protein IJG37_09880 [Synergistaceae bacterium]|nr:hypothetical protein [Synergistaceae bacterium]MBQ7169843.1 hypothetical protein [Synergistaceae bacterium]
MAGIKRLQGETDKEYWSRVEGIIDSLDDVVRVNGQEIARLPAGTLGASAIIDSLTGIFRADYDLDEVKSEALREKYGLAY